MSGGQGNWPTTVPESSSLVTQVAAGKEIARRHPLLLASVFALIALGALLVGLLIPKHYVASTTILVEDSNIIGPLMEGRAVPTGVANRAMIAGEVAFSRRVMDEILETGGWLANKPDAVSRDKLIEEIQERTEISSPRPNLIRISYRDPDPQRAYKVTRRLSELVISESLATKARESRQAFEFIDSQVKQYHQKLTQAEADLEKYRQSNPDARPGVVADVNSRIGELRRLVDAARMDLIDSSSEAGSLRSQLTGESATSDVRTRAIEVRSRIAELNAERERLLLSYTEQYPDVVRLTHQIADLQEELGKENSRSELRRAATPGALSGSLAMNPLYGQLRSRLSDAHQRRAASASRVATAQALLQEEMERSRSIASSESALAQLTRDYEVNRDLYQDLLKRRENARVSMNLDAKQEGLSFRVQEPASVPVRPSGLRLMHVALAGLALAILAPLLLLAGMIKFDPRVRSPVQIERASGLPVLGVVPQYHRHGKRRRGGGRRASVASMLFLSVPLVFGFLFAYRMVIAS